MKVINHDALAWPKNRPWYGKPYKAYSLDWICRIMGNEQAYHFFLGILGFRPEGSIFWKRFDWIHFMKNYIMDPITGRLAEQVALIRFKNTFVHKKPYYHYLEREWYV